MAQNNEKMAIIQKIMTSPEVLTVFCIATNMPFVECNSESFCDQVFMFESEELIKEFATPYIEKKIPLRGVKYLEKDKMKLLTAFLCINADEIVYIAADGRHVLKVSDIVRRNDFSKLPKEQQPIENPQLQLAGLYFAQEASRPVPVEEKPDLKELEEELAANMVKATYIIPIDIMEGEGTDAEKIKKGQFRMPLIKTPQEETFQPIFSDHIELAKYNKENKLKAMAVPFANLERLLVPDVKGFMLNPNGFHLTMPKELIKGLKVRFGVEDTPVKPAE